MFRVFVAPPSPLASPSHSSPVSMWPPSGLLWPPIAAACAQGGLLARRGFAVEIAAAKVCREAGARVSSNIMVCDLDLPAPRQAFDGRRLEIVAEGLPIFGACSWRSTRRWSARRRKERTYPELVGPRSRARLVVLTGEVGGRWSAETAKAKARTEPPVLRLRAELAWRARWGSILACAAARALAWSLLGLRGGPGANGHTPGNTRCDSRVRSQFGSPRLMVVALVDALH